MRRFLRPNSEKTNAPTSPSASRRRLTCTNRRGFRCRRLDGRRKPPLDIFLEPPLGHMLERVGARIARCLAQALLDAEELVVLRDAVGARQGAGLDLPRIGGDC